MDKTEIPFAHIEALRAEIESRALSAHEVTDVFLARIEKIDPDVGGYVAVWPERAREAARCLDEKQAAGASLGPLHGIPIAIKDLCDVAGFPTKAGTTVLGREPARETAHVVARLEEAGAVILGKTKMTEGAFVAHHPSVKKPFNPWRMSRWTGISSSGAGCVVAAGMATAALGTDTGGSIRYPSAACSLTSLKPTHGRISLHGIFPFAPSLDTVGPMARSVQDAATLYAVMAGRDPRDGWSFKAKVPEPILGPVKPKSRRVRIGVDKKFAGCIVDRDVMDVFHNLLSDLRNLDVQFVEIHLPDLSEVHPAWLTIATSELALSHAATYPAESEQYGPALRAAIVNGLAQTGGQVARAWQVREEWKRRLEACFEEIDVIISPIFPGRLGLDTDLLDPKTFPDAATAVRLATPFNLSGSPVLTLPCGTDRGDIPVTIQLVGPQHGEARLLALGQAYQSSSRWHDLRPIQFRPGFIPNAEVPFEPLFRLGGCLPGLPARG